MSINRRKLLTDDNVLRLAAAATAFGGIHASVFPEHFHDTVCETKHPRSTPHNRWMGLFLTGMAVQTLAPTYGGNDRSKKNALKVFGSCAIVAGARHALLWQNKYEKTNVAVGLVGANAALAGLCLHQAYKMDIL